jgi:Rne/Rng family ribonuclease
MTKELFVSSTPHETKVGMVEDDQLAEIYLERENEYTLAGSIYKGRVTRVLPGMQSAFVDVGLERDAFLYVSDFMELEDQDEIDELPSSHSGIEPTHPSSQPEPTESPLLSSSVATADSQTQAQREVVPLAENREPPTSESRDNRGWRGRRRRRGRRGERLPESKFAHPAAEGKRESHRSEREDYAPPSGYQPMILPGESISKYQRAGQGQAPKLGAQVADSKYQQAQPLAEIFPDDEPIFARNQAHEKPESERPESARIDRAPGDEKRLAAGAGEPVGSTGFSGTGSPESREQKRLDQMDVAEMFGGVETESPEWEEQDPVPTVPGPGHAFQSPPAGNMEQEEIEEEEADLAQYVEELEEDAAFEELEEETHRADEYQPGGPEMAASREPAPSAAVPFSPEPVSLEAAEVAETEELDEVAEDEAALDEAQAEAEAVLDAEGRFNGRVDARAEVRPPAATAAYAQRTPRPAFDRRGPRGRRGGRRFRRHEPRNLPLITDLLKEGQEILVQIAKEPIGKKGARITSHIALPGRFLVYMPTVNHTGVSRKISSDEERQRLKRIIQSEREHGHGGFIVRTAAQGAAEEELRADIRFLKGLWAEIRSRADSSKSPALIYHDLNVVERVLRDQVTSDFSAIWVDSEQEYERILRFANRFQPALVRRVKLYTKETPLFEQFGLTDEINKALKSKVWLKSGGYIVINQTEALVAIDVNTGKYVGKTARLEDTIVKTNVDAIREIVRQIRLRDLGGIIVIDFIDMDERRNRQKVMQALEEALRNDRAPSKVLQFNDFGLVAITRKRVKQSLERTIGSPCPYCSATGFVKSVQTVCNEIYLEMRKIARHLEHPDVMLRVNPEVAKALKSNNGRALNEMEELTKKTVIVKSDPALHQEQFDIN